MAFFEFASLLGLHYWSGGGGGSSFNKFDSTLCQDGLMSTNCSFGKILGKFNSNKEFCPSPDVQLFGWVEGVVVGIL